MRDIELTLQQGNKAHAKQQHPSQTNRPTEVSQKTSANFVNLHICSPPPRSPVREVGRGEAGQAPGQDCCHHSVMVLWTDQKDLGVNGRL